MAHGKFKRKNNKGETQEQRDARLVKQQIQRRAENRARHWHRVSQQTVTWMQDNDLL